MTEEVTKVEKKPGEALRTYGKKYGKAGHCGDEIAQLLKDATNTNGKADGEKIDAVASENGIDMSKYASLNIGMKRMSLGNRLRGMHNSGKEVSISGTKIPGASVKEAAPAA